MSVSKTTPPCLYILNKFAHSRASLQATELSLAKARFLEFFDISKEAMAK